jgi:hypothetical protein
MHHQYLEGFNIIFKITILWLENLFFAINLIIPQCLIFQLPDGFSQLVKFPGLFIWLKPVKDIRTPEAKAIRQLNDIIFK